MISTHKISKYNVCSSIKYSLIVFFTVTIIIELSHSQCNYIFIPMYVTTLVAGFMNYIVACHVPILLFHAQLKYPPMVVDDHNL